MNPNHAGLILGSLLLLGLAYIAAARTESAGGCGGWRGAAATWCTRLRLGLAGALVGVAGLGLLATYSRGVILGTGLALVLWLAFTRARRWQSGAHTAAMRPLGWALLALALSVLPLLGWVGRDSTQPVLRRALSWSNPDDFSWRNRVEFLAPAWCAIRERHRGGWGAGRLEAEVAGWHAPLHRPDSRAHSQNSPLQPAGAWGLPLGAALAAAALAALAALALTLRNERRSAGVSAWALGFLALQVVGFLLQGTLAHGPSGLFWLFAIACAPLAAKRA